MIRDVFIFKTLLVCIQYRRNTHFRRLNIRIGSKPLFGYVVHRLDSRATSVDLFYFANLLYRKIPQQIKYSEADSVAVYSRHF